MLDDLCREYGRQGVMAYFSSIPPVLSGGQFKGLVAQYQGKSLDFADAVVAYVAQKHIKTVILVAYWSQYDPTDSFKTQMVATVNALAHSGARVWVMKDVPTPSIQVPRIVAMNYLLHRDLNNLGVTPDAYRQRNRMFDDTFVKMAGAGATFLDPTHYFLNAKGIYGVIKDDQVLFSDGSHVTAAGSRLLAPLLRPVIQSAGSH